MFALYRIRSLGLDRERIADMVAFSGTTTLPYASRLRHRRRGHRPERSGKWLGDWWLWLAIVVLVVTTVLMTLIAKPYFQRIGGLRDPSVGRPSGERRGAARADRRPEEQGPSDHDDRALPASL